MDPFSLYFCFSEFLTFFLSSFLPSFFPSFLPFFLLSAPLMARHLLALPSVLLKHFYGITFLAWPFLLRPEYSLSLFFLCTKYQYFPSLIFSFLFPFVFCFPYLSFTFSHAPPPPPPPFLLSSCSLHRQSRGARGNTSTHDHNFENEKDCDFA